MKGGNKWRALPASSYVTLTEIGNSCNACYFSYNAGIANL